MDGLWFLSRSSAEKMIAHKSIARAVVKSRGDRDVRYYGKRLSVLGQSFLFMIIAYGKPPP